MRKAKPEDRVLVHYVVRFADGAEVSSRSCGADPLEVIVGRPHHRLPGLTRELCGLTPGEGTFVAVPAGQAYPPPDPKRVVKVARSRFPIGQSLSTGRRVRLSFRSGRERTVRIVSATDRYVTVDANHHRAGQGVELEIELVAIVELAADPASL